MTERRQKIRKNEVVINVTFLLSVILLLISAYTNYIVKTTNEKIDKNFGLIMALQEKVQHVELKIKEHIGWHNGRSSK